MSNRIKYELKEEILKEIEGKLEEFQNKNNAIIEESNKIIEENKRIFECFLQQKYQLDKLESIEKVVNKCNDSLVSHEIRITNNKNELGVIQTKYDKIVLDNLYVQGFIGPSCQYKNLASYIKNSVNEFSKMKIENEAVKRETKDFKVKLDTASKNVTNLIDGGVLRCNNYTDNRINDFHIVLENKIKEIGEKNMDLRMKNIHFQSKLEQQLKDLKNEYEEKMLKQKEEISQILNNKIEHLNMNLLSLDKNPKFIEMDEIKTKSNQLEKDIKEIKQYISKGGDMNINLYSNQEQRTRRTRRKSVMYENENINGIFENIKNNYLNVRKSISNNSNNVNIVNNNNVQNSNNKFGSSSKIYHLENDKNNNLNEISSPRFERKDKNKQQTLSPLKSRFYNESNSNIILSSNTNNNFSSFANAYNANKGNKGNLSYKVINNSKTSNNNNEEYYNKTDINKSKSIPKKFNSKSNLINMKDKIVSKDNNYMNKIKSYDNNNNNSGGNSNNNSNNNNNKNRSTNINNEIIKNISNINHSKIKNNNYNLTNPINEDSDSFISISNSSKDEDIINNTYNKTSNDLSAKAKLLFLNKKNNILSNNISNMLDKKSPLNIMNKSEKNKLYLNKIKNLNPNMELDNNDSKINSRINYNKSQSNYREEIVKELFTKYDKGNMTINLNQIKNKGNLDLYNYSISPPDNKYIGKAKINELYEPPFNKDIFFNKNKIMETNNLKHYYTKRNLSVKPSLNMQLYYGNFNMKKKEKNSKVNYLSNSNINGKNKHNTFGKTAYSDYVNKEDLFTMTSYKNKK